MRRLAVVLALASAGLATSAATGAAVAVEPPAPVAAAMPAEVGAGPFFVFFDWNKAEITGDGEATLDNAAAAYQLAGTGTVRLAGLADRSGSRRYNIALAQRRVDAVKAYLIGKGVPEVSITSLAPGEARPLIPTANGVREAQNRRVEVRVGE